MVESNGSRKFSAVDQKEIRRVHETAAGSITESVNDLLLQICGGTVKYIVSSSGSAVLSIGFRKFAAIEIVENC